MRRLFVFSLLLLLIFLGFGCRKAEKGLSKKTSESKQGIVEVDDIKLAEAILWTKPYQFSLSRDPFKPLTGESSLLMEEEMEFLNQADTDIYIFGILKKEEGSIALLELPSGVGLVREGDKIGKYTVERIDSDRVILESEGERKILEIGGEE